MELSNRYSNREQAKEKQERLNQSGFIMSLYDRAEQLQNDTKKIYGNSIAFRVPKNACIQLPCPTYRTEDKEGYIYVYAIKETTPTATQFQMLNTIKLNIEWSVKSAKFEDGIQVAYNDLQTFFTISELYKLFDCEFIKYKLPLIAQNKKDLQKHISMYAQRMWYERKLHIEIVLFVANFLNNKLPTKDRYSHREVFRKAVSAFNYVDRTQKQQLSFKELRKAYINGAKLTHTARREQQALMAQFMNSFISQCIKPNGKVNIKKLHELTSIPISTIYKLMKLYPSSSNSKRAIMPIASEKKISQSPIIGSIDQIKTYSSIMPIASENFLYIDELEEYFKLEYKERFLGIQEVGENNIILCIDDYELLTVPIPLSKQNNNKMLSLQYNEMKGIK